MSRDDELPSFSCARTPAPNWWRWCVVLVLTIVVVVLAELGYATAAAVTALLDLVAAELARRFAGLTLPRREPPALGA